MKNRIVICILTFNLILIFLLVSYKTWSTGEYNSWATDLIGYDNGQYEEEIKIAILDSGINKDHLAFKNTKFIEYNTISNEKIIDNYGHGTAIAGIIAGQSDKLQGLMVDSTIYDVKVLDDSGVGELENIIEGVEWCISNEVDVINISFGFSTDYSEFKSAIDKAINAGIIVVAAGGNTMGLSVDYPAKYEKVISIGSFDQNMEIDVYSANDEIDYYMPGVNVLSIDKGGEYSYFSGTSFATAYATGAISSIIRNYPEQDLEKFSVPIHENSKVKMITLKKGVHSK